MEGPLLTKSEHILDVTIDGNSSSVDDQTPQEGTDESNYNPYRFWTPTEFVVTLVQIVPALIVLIQPRDEEHPQTILFIWIIGYTCGCIAILLILCWRFWYHNRSVISESSTEENSVATM